MIDKIIQYISSFIYSRDVDVYSLETDYMDVHGTNYEEIYQMKIKLGIAPIAWSNDDMPELGGDTPIENCLQAIQ